MTETTGHTEDNSTSSSNGAPKKLKLTLKLNSSSSSSSSSSNLASSTTASPTKIETSSAVPSATPTGFTVDLPTGLGNAKGRGRPKKTGISSNSAATASSEDPSSSTSASSSEYAADLKSFVAAMKSFKPRKWSMKRPVSGEMRNVGGFEINFPCGLWCTFTGELGSAPLTAIHSNSNQFSAGNPSSSTANQEETSFEATCQCGKLFTDRSKYRKHVKIHDKKPKTGEAATIEENRNFTTSTTTAAATTTATIAPMISLKLKLKPE